MAFTSPQGTSDILPADHDYFNFITKVVRYRFRQAGFQRIAVPAFEETALYEQALGLDTKIISSELYTFTDPRGRSLSLRPEITPGIVRSFIEHHMDEQALPQELYYIDRVWRYQRLKSGTKREFWQFGGEVLGETDPAIDAQLIYLGHRILRDLSVRDLVELRINTLGSHEDRVKYFEALQNFYTGKERALTPGSREMLQQRRYLQLLDPKSEDEEILLQMAPKMLDFLSKKSRDLYEQMRRYLEMFEIPYTLDPTLVRPVEYYNHTVFEFRKTGTRQKILVGGRYDGLIEQLGGQGLGGAGFQCGMERTIDLMLEKKVAVPKKGYIQIFVAATGNEAKRHALPLLVQLREHGLHAVGAMGNTSMIEQLQRAQKFRVPYTLLLGDTEVENGTVLLREMKRGRSEEIPRERLLEHLDSLLTVDKPLDTTLEFLGHA
ncbi:histidine--tRNA ligase [Candidatus Peribacteria bacterium]|nr:histidine--tRNA ligase [Candidatus Peribacteria bacterium]